MKIGAAFPSRFLKADDLQGRTFQVQIAALRVEDVGQEGKPEHKPVLYFSYQGRQAEKGWVLNRTNADTLSMDLGDETDQWIGHTVELFSMRVQGPNGLTNGIRCRVIHPADTRPNPAFPSAAPPAQRSAPASGPYGPEPPQAAPGAYTEAADPDAPPF